MEYFLIWKEILEDLELIFFVSNFLLTNLVNINLLIKEKLSIKFTSEDSFVTTKKQQV